MPNHNNNNNDASNNKKQKTEKYTVGIVGASGAVGKEILKVLEKSPLPVKELRLFGSPRSAGTTVGSSKFGTCTVELFEKDLACECDILFLAVSGSFALEHAKAIAETGTVVIDNSVSTQSSHLLMMMMAV